MAGRLSDGLRSLAQGTGSRAAHPLPTDDLQPGGANATGRRDTLNRRAERRRRSSLRLLQLAYQEQPDGHAMRGSQSDGLLPRRRSSIELDAAAAATGGSSSHVLQEGRRSSIGRSSVRAPRSSITIDDIATGTGLPATKLPPVSIKTANRDHPSFLEQIAKREADTRRRQKQTSRLGKVLDDQLPTIETNGRQREARSTDARGSVRAMLATRADLDRLLATLSAKPVIDRRDFVLGVSKCMAHAASKEEVKREAKQIFFEIDREADGEVTAAQVREFARAAHEAAPAPSRKQLQGSFKGGGGADAPSFKARAAAARPELPDELRARQREILGLWKDWQVFTLSESFKKKQESITRAPTHSESFKKRLVHHEGSTEKHQRISRIASLVFTRIDTRAVQL